ncbi:plastid delta12-fatty acid acetylenase [Tanacetum coccineum]|uniref:Plastid delta12-fatty acid acetylenase n=1 Tax=Tanacetum coccineum TaxID=301880 RepID=A0ABQ5A382_9ASTR
MGAGGRMSDSFEHEVKDILKCVPVDPPFSLSDLKKAITAHCFKRSVIRSSYYVVHDLIVAYVFYFLANTYIPLLPTPLAYLASAVILNIFKDRHIIYVSSIFSSRKDWVGISVQPAYYASRP